MKLNEIFNKTKYSLMTFAVLVLLTLVYGSSDAPLTLGLRFLFCLCTAVFFQCFVTDENEIYFPAFAFAGLISFNTVFLTDDVHILLSLPCFLSALIFSKKFTFLSVIFAGLCVLCQPLAILFFVPWILFVLTVKKNYVPAVLSAVISAAAFIVTKNFSDIDFYRNQFCSYHLSLHPVYFSNAHLEALTEYALACVPLIALILFFVFSFAVRKKFLTAGAFILAIFLSLLGFAMSENLHTAFLVLVPATVSPVCLKDTEAVGDSVEKLNLFFRNRHLLFLLLIVFTVSYPLIFGALPYGSDFFSKSTFIIFRQE